MSENKENTEIQENEEEKVLDIEDILAAKVKKDEENSKPIEVYIKSLGGKVKFIKPTVKQMKKVGFKSISNKPKDMDDAQRQLIYDCCPLLKQNYKKLREVYEVNSNLDIVDAVFDDANVQSKILMKLQGKTDEEIQEAYETIKNS